MESGKHQASMELISKIIARMKAEGATSATSFEIQRCLSGCVSCKKLINYALNNINKLNELYHG
jgi:hypothetical protein